MVPSHGDRRPGEFGITESGGRQGIALKSAATGPEGRLADAHSAWHDNISPPLGWTPVAEALSYALVVEDPDAPTTLPFVHWMIWNIPGDSEHLPPAIAARPWADRPGGAVQGRNDAGGYGWHGPGPRTDKGPHRCRFRLFALDRRLDIGPDTPLDELFSAVAVAILAEGRLEAAYVAPTSQ